MLLLFGLWQPTKESSPIVPPGVEGTLLLESSLVRTTRTQEGMLLQGSRATALTLIPPYLHISLSHYYS